MWLKGVLQWVTKASWRRKKTTSDDGVEKVSKDQRRQNIDSHLREEESTTGPIKELVEIQMYAKEPSQVVKVDKCFSNELVQKLVNFLREN